MYHGLFKLSTIVEYLVLSNLSVLQTVMQWKLCVCVCKFVLVQVTYTDLSVGLIYKSGVARLRVNTFAVWGNIAKRPSIVVGHLLISSVIYESACFYFFKASMTIYFKLLEFCQFGRWEMASQRNFNFHLSYYEWRYASFHMFKGA